VAETRAILVSLEIASPIFLSPIIRLKTPSGIPLSYKTSAKILWQAIAVKGVFSEGFQTLTLPQTAAIMAFQAQTATGKLKAEIIHTIPKG